MTDLVPLRTNRLVPDEQGQLKLITPEGEPFEFTAEWLSRFQDENGNWLEEGWPVVEAISICRTEGCSQYGIELPIILGENVDGIFRNVCGPCHQQPDLYERPTT